MAATAGTVVAATAAEWQTPHHPSLPLSVLAGSGLRQNSGAIHSRLWLAVCIPEAAVVILFMNTGVGIGPGSLHVERTLIPDIHEGQHCRYLSLAVASVSS